MPRKQAFRILSASLVLATALPLPAWSQPTPATNPAPCTITLQEVVVTALRLKEDIQSVPYTAYHISSSSVQSKNSDRTTPDTLKGKPSVFVQKTSYGQGSPYLRGFTGFRTLFLVNGIRLNNSVFRDGPNQYWNTVDPFSISDYEMVMGPASVLYGSDAVGGTVNAICTSPPDFNGSPAWQSKAIYRGASAERSNIGRIQASGRPAENLGFTGGLSLKEFGNLRGGNNVGVQEHTGYSELDYDARLDYYFNKDSSLTIGHQSVDQDDAWRSHKTIYGIDWQGLKKGDDKVHTFDQNRNLTYAKYRTDNIDGFINSIEATLSYQLQAEDLYRLKKDDTGEKQGFDVGTWGSTIQLDSETAIGDWTYGIEYYHDNVESYGRTYKADSTLNKIAMQGPVADDSTYDSLGFYLQDAIHLFDGGLDVIPGARYTFSRAEADKVKDPLSGKQIAFDDCWDAAVGSLRLLHSLVKNRDHVIFAGVSQGFRAPNLSDLTRFDIARSSELETSTLALEPEKYMAYEAGIKSRFDKLTATLSWYYTDIDDMIVRTPTGRIIDSNTEVTKKNSGDGYIHGTELSANYAFTRTLSAWVTGSLTSGKVDSYPTSAPEQERMYVTRLMPPATELGLRCQTVSGRYWAEAVCDMAAKADKLSAEDRRDTQRIPPGGTPGYAVYTARTGARVTDSISLTATVENIFDEDYRIHGSGINEPGRNFILTASCTF